MSAIRMIKSGLQWKDNLHGDVMVIQDRFSGHWLVCTRNRRPIEGGTVKPTWRSLPQFHKTSEEAIGHAEMLLADREAARQAAVRVA